MHSRTIEDIAIAATLREAIHSRLADRRFYRSQRQYGKYWRDLDIENGAKLRELVRVARHARDVARPIVEREEAEARLLAMGDPYGGMAS